MLCGGKHWKEREQTMLVVIYDQNCLLQVWSTGLDFK